jgi:hypothetical protein
VKQFDGLFSGGALKILDYLLPRDDIEFNIQELANDAGVAWKTAQRVVNKFADLKIIKKVGEYAGISYYELNNESPYVVLFENLNRLLIEHMLGDEALLKIRGYVEERESVPEPKPERYGLVAEDTSSAWPTSSQRIRPDECYPSMLPPIAYAQIGRGPYGAA